MYARDRSKFKVAFNQQGCLSGCLHVTDKNNSFEEYLKIAIFILFNIKTASLQGEQISGLRIPFQFLLPYKYHSKFDRFAICVLCFLLISLVDETATSDWTDIYSFEIRHTYVYFHHTMLFQF